MGLFIGIGAYTFRYAEGLSYFSTDPAACAEDVMDVVNGALVSTAPQ